MSWIAAGTAAVGVAGAVIGGQASAKAAKQQRRAAQRGQETARQTYEQIRADQQPYTNMGLTGSNLLMQGIGDGVSGDLTRRFTNDDFVKDPGYQFRMDEGAKGVEAGAASRGGLLSGAAAKALEQYSQGFASNEYGNAYNRYNTDQGNRYNRLLGITGIGQNASNTVANAGSRFGDQSVGLSTAAGNAQSAGTIGTANAYSSGLNAVGNAGPQYQTNQLLSNIWSRPATTPTANYGNLATNTGVNYGANPISYSDEH